MIIHLESVPQNKLFYSEEDFPPHTFEKVSSDIPLETVPQGEFKDRKYRLLTFGIKESLLWSISKGFIVVLLATITIGLALLLSSLQNLWQEARAGRKFRQLKILKNESPSVQKTAQIAPAIIKENIRKDQKIEKDITSSDIRPPLETKKETNEKRDPTPLLPGPHPIFSPPPVQDGNLWVNFLDPFHALKIKYKDHLENLKKLTKEEVQALNFSDLDQEPLTKEIIVTMAGDSKGWQFIKWISADQIAQIDFTKWDLHSIKSTGREIYSPFFDLLFNESQKLASIQNESLPLIIPFIKEKLHNLNEKQIQSLDFSSKGPITREILIAMANLNDPVEKNRGKVFKWMTTAQIEQLDFTKWNVHAVNQALIRYLFLDISRVSIIKINQVPYLLPLLDQNQMKGLTQKQIQSLDFSENGPVTNEMLITKMANLSDQEEDKRGQIIKCLTSDQILSLLKRKILNPAIAKFTTYEQISKLDYKQWIKDEKELSFHDRNYFTSILNAMLEKTQPSNPILENVSKTVFIPVAYFPFVVKWIQASNLKELTKEQIQSIDFKNMQQNQFLGMANLDDKVELNRGQNIKFLTPEQLIHLLTIQFLDETTAMFVTSNQIAGIDFRKITVHLNNRVINRLFSDDAKVSSIQKESLPHLMPLIDSVKLKALNKEQVQSLDFSKSDHPVTKEMLTGMANLKDQEENKRGEVIRLMTVAQIKDLFQTKRFDLATADCISNEQLKEISDNYLTGFGRLIKRKRAGK